MLQGARACKTHATHAARLCTSVRLMPSGVQLAPHAGQSTTPLPSLPSYWSPRSFLVNLTGLYCIPACSARPRIWPLSRLKPPAASLVLRRLRSRSLHHSPPTVAPHPLSNRGVYPSRHRLDSRLLPDGHFAMRWASRPCPSLEDTRSHRIRTGCCARCNKTPQSLLWVNPPSLLRRRSSARSGLQQRPRCWWTAVIR